MKSHGAFVASERKTGHEGLAIFSPWPLYVLIPNWNLAWLTVDCVRSLLDVGSGLAVRVLVIDNGSTDSSTVTLREQFGDQIDVLCLGQNRGFAVAVNEGIRAALAAQAGSVLVLNNDTLVAQDMLAALGMAAEAQPEAGILAPAIFYYDVPARVGGWVIAGHAGRRSPTGRRIVS